MSELKQYFCMMVEAGVNKLIISNPSSKSGEYKKIVVEKKKEGFQISKYTQKQVFHENVNNSDVESRCVELTEGNFKQVNGLSEKEEHIVLISKKGKCNYKIKKWQMMQSE